MLFFCRLQLLIGIICYSICCLCRAFDARANVEIGGSDNTAEPTFLPWIGAGNVGVDHTDRRSSKSTAIGASDTLEIRRADPFPIFFGELFEGIKAAMVRYFCPFPGFPTFFAVDRCIKKETGEKFFFVGLTFPKKFFSSE